jgi:hypothetical protein
MEDFWIVSLFFCFCPSCCGGFFCVYAFFGVCCRLVFGVGLWLGVCLVVVVVVVEVIEDLNFRSLMKFILVN